MSCKGGCGGGCNDCKKISAKKADCHDCAPVFTGDIIFDGTNFACELDPAFSMTKDEVLNSILEKVFPKLCVLSTPTIYSSELITQNFGIAFAPIATVDATILQDGIYSVYAVLNYKHGLALGFPIIYCEGDATLLKDGVEISSDIRKQLSSEMNAAGEVPNNALVATLLYVGDFIKDEVITIGVRSTLSNFYTSIGAQIIVKRELNFVVQP